MSLYTCALIKRLQDAISTLAPQWNFSRNAPIQLLNISENVTFLFNEGAKRHIIRAYRPHYHTDEEILSELCWMQALEKADIVSLPHVFPTLDDKLFTTAMLDDTRWRFAAFSYLEGEAPKVDNNLISWFARLGEISAHLHIQAHLWQRPRDFTRKSWTFDTMIGPHAYWGDWRAVPGLSSAHIACLEQCADILKTTEQTFPRDENFSLIHGDLRLANLLARGKSLAIIDFDDCGFSWFATDLANALSFIEDKPLIPQLISSWFEGYGKVKEPTKTMKMMVPHLIMMRRMQLSAWLTSHAEIPTAIKLNNYFHQGTVKLAKNYLKTYT